MSTKGAITQGNLFNLYEDKFDENNVYLELTNGEFRSACNWEGSTHVAVCIPHHIMDAIADAWIKHRRSGGETVEEPPPAAF